VKGKKSIAIATAPIIQGLSLAAPFKNQTVFCARSFIEPQAMSLNFVHIFPKNVFTHFGSSILLTLFEAESKIALKSFSVYSQFVKLSLLSNIHHIEKYINVCLKSFILEKSVSHHKITYNFVVSTKFKPFSLKALIILFHNHKFKVSLLSIVF
jgi:hypothetical protein